jgi:hypothetical protein
MQKRGQNWSLDIVLAFIVFVLIIAIFYTLLTNNTSSKTDQLQLEANTLANNLDSSTGLDSKLSIMYKSSVDSNKASQLFDSDYDSLKNQFGFRGDFCIYIVDNKGNLVTVNTSRGYVNGFGNGNLSINGHPCGTVMP